MFGLEKQKKKKFEEFVFPLEDDLKNAKKHQELKKAVEARIQSLKETLRIGEDKEHYDQFGALLHGYTSLLKVISRFSPK